MMAGLAGHMCSKWALKINPQHHPTILPWRHFHAERCRTSRYQYLRWDARSKYIATNIWTHLWRWCCRHQRLHCSRSQRCHLPKLQQKRILWQQYAEHAWADLGPSRYCLLDLPAPMWQSCYLHRTTMPTRSLLQLLWASVPQQLCCLHFETQKLESHRGQQAFSETVPQRLLRSHFQIQNGATQRKP